MNMDVVVTLKGPFFTKNLDAVVEKAIVEETLRKVDERVQRGGKGLGAKRNIVSRKLTGLMLHIDTTKIRPRTRGTSWQRKNLSIIKAMVPRVVRKTALRIAGEL